MIFNGTFKIVSTNIITGEKKELEKGNVITNRFYREVLEDGSNSSIGFYLWTSPYEMTRSRRRITTEASALFLNDAYGYIPDSDWFARYVIAEDNQPGYFETRARLDPPASGIRVIRSLMMTGTQSRTDNITGLLPEYGPNTITDIRTTNMSSSVSKLAIYAFVTLDDDCIQSDIEVFDIYYRLVFDNNYADVNLSKTALEIIGKQSTARMPAINNVGNHIMSTPIEPPAMSNEGPVNFITGTLTPTGVNPTNGDFWYDYGNIIPASVVSDGYTRTYSASLEKDHHVGKLISTLYLSGYNMGGYVSGYKNIHQNGERTIGNTHSHNDIALKPFFDPSNLARGTGYCDMTSTQIPEFPEFIEVEIVESGSSETAQYRIRKYPYTGFYKNTYEVLPIEVPNLGQIVIYEGSWRGGIHQNGTDYMHGFLTGRAGIHPSVSGLSYNSSEQHNTIIGRMGINEYSGIREYSEYELLGYDKDGLSIQSLSGSIRSINRFKNPQFAATNIIQVEVEEDTGYIYAACKDTGLYRVNSTMTSSVKIIPLGVAAGEKCYGFGMYQDKKIAWFDSGIYYSIDNGATWTTTAHPDYDANGLDKTKIIGIRADLTSITPNILVLFSTYDGTFTSDQTKILAAWWSPTIFNILNVSPPMYNSGVSPSFTGIDYTMFLNGTFYLTYGGAVVSSANGVSIQRVLFNTSTLTTEFSFQSSSVNGIPKVIKKNGNDYLLTSNGGTLYVFNMTDSLLESSIPNYGHNIWYVNSLNMGFSPYYYSILSSGLVLYRGTSSYTNNMWNSGSVHNIRTDVIRETADTIVTKVINPFYNSSSKWLFEKVYGWDGNQFTTSTTTPKTISSGVNLFNGITLEFTGLLNVSDFVSGDKFSAIRAKGMVKDNASLAKIFFSNSHFIKSQKYYQSGTISPSSSFKKLGKFEFEEANVRYDDSHFYIDSRSTPYDFLTTRKIPQEAGTMRIVAENMIDGGYAVLFNIDGPNNNENSSFGISIYKTGTGLKCRITSAGPSYQRGDMVSPNTSYTEQSISAGDVIEVVWSPGSTKKVFSLKINGTVISSGLNFDGAYGVTNSSQMTLYYVPLTIAYPSQQPEIQVIKPEFRYDSTSTQIAIPLSEFHLNDSALAINGNNYGVGGDTTIYVNGFLSENTGINATDRSIIVGHCSIDNISGTIYFSRDDENKGYSAEYFYYKDSV